MIVPMHLNKNSRNLWNITFIVQRRLAFDGVGWYVHFSHVVDGESIANYDVDNDDGYYEIIHMTFTENHFQINNVLAKQSLYLIH